VPAASTDFAKKEENIHTQTKPKTATPANLHTELFGFHRRLLDQPSTPLELQTREQTTTNYLQPSDLEAN
jgi:hypothetical protein